MPVYTREITIRAQFTAPDPQAADRYAADLADEASDRLVQRDIAGALQIGSVTVTEPAPAATITDPQPAPLPCGGEHYFPYPEELGYDADAVTWRYGNCACSLSYADHLAQGGRPYDESAA